jgi:hypothetical protein
MKRLLVVLLVSGAVTSGDRPPSRLHVLKGALAPYATVAGIVVVRDATGRPIRFHFTPALVPLFQICFRMNA